MVAIVRLGASLLGATVTFVLASDEYFEGNATNYILQAVSNGNCNFMSAIPTAAMNYVALNDQQWDKLGNCGRCIEASCIDERCTVKDKKAVVQVLDQCPGCGYGALDLPPALFKEITGFNMDRLLVRWRFVDCPNPGTVQVCLKGGSNPTWVAIQPTNSVVGVQSVSVNGGITTMLDGAYYYVSNHSITDLSAIKVAITSIHGDVIAGTYSLVEGQCTDTKKQFTSGVSSQSPPAYTGPSTPISTTPTTPKSTPPLDFTTPSTTTTSKMPAPSTAPDKTSNGHNLTSPSSQNDNMLQNPQDHEQNAAPSTATPPQDDNIGSEAMPAKVIPASPNTEPETSSTVPEHSDAAPVTPDVASKTPIILPDTPVDSNTAVMASTAPPNAPIQTDSTSKCPVKRRPHQK